MNDPFGHLLKTWSKKFSKVSQPSPFLLQHAIVLVRLNGKLHLSHCEHRQWYDYKR
jgi:hypothetical protein